MVGLVEERGASSKDGSLSTLLCSWATDGRAVVNPRPTLQGRLKGGFTPLFRIRHSSSTSKAASTQTYPRRETLGARSNRNLREVMAKDAPDPAIRAFPQTSRHGCNESTTSVQRAMRGFNLSIIASKGRARLDRMAPPPARLRQSAATIAGVNAAEVTLPTHHCRHCCRCHCRPWILIRPSKEKKNYDGMTQRRRGQARRPCPGPQPWPHIRLSFVPLQRSRQRRRLATTPTARFRKIGSAAGAAAQGPPIVSFLIAPT